MWPHRNHASIGLTTTISQITDEFFTGVKLRTRWPISIKIAHETNTERNIVQIIAVHMSPINLAAPAVAYFDLTVSSGCSVPDHKMIGKTILHPAHMPMVIIEDARVPLPRATIVYHNELPATPFDGCSSDRVDHRSR